MKPRFLKPGDRVICKGNLMTFVRRERNAQPTLNVFQCDAFRGLNSPTDPGLCTMNDAYAARHCTRDGAAQ